MQSPDMQYSLTSMMTLTTKQQPAHKVMNSRLLEVSINQFQNKIREYGMLEYWLKGLYQAHCTFLISISISKYVSKYDTCKLAYFFLPYRN